jgi:hypothetical protein
MSRSYGRPPAGHLASQGVPPWNIFDNQTNRLSASYVGAAIAPANSDFATKNAQDHIAPGGSRRRT